VIIGHITLGFSIDAKIEPPSKLSKNFSFPTRSAILTKTLRNRAVNLIKGFAR